MGATRSQQVLLMYKCVRTMCIGRLLSKIMAQCTEMCERCHPHRARSFAIIHARSYTIYKQHHPSSRKPRRGMGTFISNPRRLSSCLCKLTHFNAHTTIFLFCVTVSSSISNIKSAPPFITI